MKKFLKLSFITGLGTGYSPIMSGTVGTLIGVLLYVLLSRIVIVYYLLVLLIIYYGAIYSTWGEIFFKEKDSGKIVIDEIAGIMITMWGFKFYNNSYDLHLLIIGFLLFRIFDIVKPYPINELQKIKGGWGVMLDDIVAGVFANVLLNIYIWVKTVI